MIDYEGQYPTGSERYFADKHDRLKYKFSGSEDIVENHSQSMQDMFVLSVLDGKKNGTYVEIGADRPRVINNTWLLESMYDWEGVSFEIDPIKSLFEERNFPKQIDYLQLDCDPPQVTLECLKKLPLDDYRFSIITFETDLYAGGHDVQKEQWEILCSLGYKRIAKNVNNEGNPYEDWWIDPSVISEDRCILFMIDDVEFSKIVLN